MTAVRYVLTSLTASGDPIEDHEIDLDAFLSANEFDDEDLAMIRALEPGDDAFVYFGGGAAVTFRLSCEPAGVGQP
jgi:hypothetical protein